VATYRTFLRVPVIVEYEPIKGTDGVKNSLFVPEEPDVEPDIDIGTVTLFDGHEIDLDCADVMILREEIMEKEL